VAFHLVVEIAEVAHQPPLPELARIRHQGERTFRFDDARARATQLRERRPPKQRAGGGWPLSRERECRPEPGLPNDAPGRVIALIDVGANTNADAWTFAEALVAPRRPQA
jgi:hypothetical protein